MIFLQFLQFYYLDKHDDDHDDHHAGDVVHEVVGDGGQAAVWVYLHGSLEITDTMSYHSKHGGETANS